MAILSNTDIITLKLSFALFLPNLSRYALLANLTGIPAMSLPVGYSKENLPVSVQLMSSWWREDLLLRVGYAIECNHVTQRPTVHTDITK